jgi:hypothetical protein
MGLARGGILLVALSGGVTFHQWDSVGILNESFAAQRPACTFPCQRFADILADVRA